MLNLSTLSTLLGAAFGLRFGVFILVPVMALELGFVALNGFAIGESAGRLAIAMSLIATSVQLGYLGGSIVGFLRRQDLGTDLDPDVRTRLKTKSAESRVGPANA